MGFTSPRQIAVYNSMKTIFGDGAEDATNTVFDLIKGELNIVGWQDKGQVQKDVENKVMRFLKTRLSQG
jgi:type I restriction enzyme R subunit